MVDDSSAELERRKLDAMKELAYGASHEINNPLANIAARAQTLLRDETHPERRRALEAIHQQSMRAHEMISDLMLFARPPELVYEVFDLRGLLMEIAERLSLVCEQRSIRIQSQLPNDPVQCNGDREQLSVAVTALVTNAIEAIGESGNICVLLNQTPVSEKSTRRATIEVADTGPGTSEEIRQHMFDPFFSGREAGRGLGFGLSKCWRIVTEHGGEVFANHSENQGASLTIQLPLHRATSPEPFAPEDTAKHSR